MASFPWWYGPRWPLRYLLPSLGGGEAFRKPLRWEHREEEGSAKCHGKSVSLLFFGDFMPMGQAPAYVSPVIQQLFRDADFVVGNLETAILDEMNWFQRIASKLFHCMSCVDFEAWMKELHVTPSKMFLSFANNHSFDWGDKGFRMTVQILRDMGITVLGVEHVPEIAQISNRIGVVSWTHWLNFQGDDEAVTTFDSVTSINWSTLKEQAGMHTLIGCPHWDYEFNFYPDKSTYMTATTLLDRGFDVLVGTHSHTPQPVVLFPSAQDSDSPSLLKQQEKSKAEKGMAEVCLLLLVLFRGM